ncbi:MAG: prepilin-type N-terminal cleavage/methylation domain-containing protein [Candidatus Omnitrophica bacterium]|nr:prepilin-type N-terminal cleavage/methylation domain-containing protein [Candidatus Omnitrophota bacterium]MCA9432173.1 prepilin-type N-terminal cleavage/methylation domain-containing protein [Candidatus Omnitrophota bacterium]
MPRIGAESRKWKIRGFTLIELLIVIAIILILIAIALPNFLEAQIRARVVKAKGEMRSLGIAMESYFLDWKVYPAEHERDETNRLQRGLAWLTTPNQYISSLPEDPFGAFSADSDDTTAITYETGGLETGEPPCIPCMVTWVMMSNGPDATQLIFAEQPTYDSGRDVRNYSPTNGTKSRGSIYKWGGDSRYIGYQGSSVFLLGNINQKTPVGLTVDGQVYIRRLPPSP